MSNISVDGVYHYNLDYDLINKHGLTYGRVASSNMKYEIKRAYYRFDNLFDGDKKLGILMFKAQSKLFAVSENYIRTIFCRRRNEQIFERKLERRRYGRRIRSGRNN